MREIIIFDSGIGGFSILQELLKHSLPHPHTYLADQAYLPYGNKQPTLLESRVNKISLWARSRDPLLFIIACNTATVNSINLARDTLACPVVGVEPVIKPLASAQHPLVLATASTLASTRNQQLLQAHNPRTLTHYPADLVDAIENMDQSAISDSLLSLTPIIKKNKVDAIGLSCTHYPLALSQLHSLYPTLKIFDPSPAIAARARSLLPPTSTPASPPSLTFLTTGDPTKLASQVQYYLRMDAQPEQIVI